jgi:hypothetical protein
VDKDLSIGDYARYAGEAHADGKSGTAGNVSFGIYVTFEQDLTAKGTIKGNSTQANQTVVFMKKHTSGAPQQPRPTTADVTATGTNPPAGTVCYDWTKTDFQNAFKAATGSLPNNTLSTAITFNVTNMTVVNKCTVSGSTKTQTITRAIPNNNFIYCAGSVNVKGHISRRTSILTPKTVTIAGPIRYVDDGNKAQFNLYNSNGTIAGFSTTSDMWTPTDDWEGKTGTPPKYKYDYREADDWETRMPVVDGQPQNPSMGIVAGGNIIIDNAGTFTNKNTEIHAAMYSCDGYETPSDTDWPGYNLQLMGTRIQTTSSPNSSAWDYRHYAYDTGLWASPPPGFPACIDPSFTNWHIIQSGDLVQ